MRSCEQSQEANGHAATEASDLGVSRDDVSASEMANQF